MEDFRRTTLARVAHAVDATYRTDPTPYLALWADEEPVSLFGALGPCRTGKSDVSAALGRVGARFSDPSMSIDYEVVEVGGDLAYTVGYEQGEVAIDGVRRPTRIRVTHIYRLEEEMWRLVHRHGDFAPSEDSGQDLS